MLPQLFAQVACDPARTRIDAPAIRICDRRDWTLAHKWERTPCTRGNKSAALAAQTHSFAAEPDSFRRLRHRRRIHRKTL